MRTAWRLFVLCADRSNAEGKQNLVLKHLTHREFFAPLTNVTFAAQIRK